MTSQSIKAHPYPAEQGRKRRYELILALVPFGLIILLSWIELRFFGVNSYIFLAIFNLNLILLLIILFLVLRNGVKLLLERRRNVRGARLRTRLVSAFMLLSLVPTVLIFLVAVKFIQTSIDYWFKSKVDSSMEQVLDVGKTLYQRIQDRLSNQGEFVVNQIRNRELLWGGEGMDRFLEQKSREYGLSLIGIVTPKFKEQNWHADQEWTKKWASIKDSIQWASLQKEPRFWSTLYTSSKKDLILGVLPVDKAKTGFMVLGLSYEHGLLSDLEEIVQGVKEYKQLKTLKNPLKTAFYLILGVMTLLILFGAMWFGFRLAKEISAPIQALSLGTQRIAHGDLAVRLEDQSGDELGLLVQSFNTMAEDLEQSQESLNKANKDLARQNLELEQRRQYGEAVLNNITSGVISLDKENTINTVNKAAENILKVTAQDIKGKNPIDLLHDDFQEVLEELFVHLQESPHAKWQRQLEVPLGHEGRKLLVNAVGLWTQDKKELGKVIVFEDITELDKMQRMAAWREVARRIAHEIKNPLTPIKLSAQRLEKRYGPGVGDGTFEECTQLIVKQVEYLQQMVTEFSSFAKLPDVTLEYDDLASLLEEMVTLFQNSHASIIWDYDLVSELPRFKFDRSAMKRVLINVFTNAVEVLKEIPEPKVQVKALYDTSSKNVILEIHDNGPGFTSEERSRMFEPYFSKKKGNTGLGLTIVKSIVNDHRGFVEVKPNTPQGSIFIVELPA
jgi:two-component system nitrogen regulation sensor histidine kinase NtrY